MAAYSGHLVCGCHDGSLQLFTSDGISKTQHKSHGDAVTAMCVLDSGSIATGSIDGSVKIVNASLENEKTLEGSTDETYSMDSNESFLVTGGEDSKLRFYNLDSESDQPHQVGKDLLVAHLSSLDMHRT